MSAKPEGRMKGRRYATCACCRIENATVVLHGRPPRPICEACWNDPALSYSECKHGRPFAKVLHDACEQDRARKRLQDAAPELLAALKVIAQHDDWDKIPPAEMVMVEEAIRKAEGCLPCKDKAR